MKWKRCKKLAPAVAALVFLASMAVLTQLKPQAVEVTPSLPEDTAATEGVDYKTVNLRAVVDVNHIVWLDETLFSVIGSGSNDGVSYLWIYLGSQKTGQAQLCDTLTLQEDESLNSALSLADGRLALCTNQRLVFFDVTGDGLRRQTTLSLLPILGDECSKIALHPSGERVAFISSQGLEVMDLTTRQCTLLAQPDEDAFLLDFCWMEDDFIAYRTIPQDGTTLCVLRPDGTEAWRGAAGLLAAAGSGHAAMESGDNASVVQIVDLASGAQSAFSLAGQNLSALSLRGGLLAAVTLADDATSYICSWDLQSGVFATHYAVTAEEGSLGDSFTLSQNGWAAVPLLSSSSNTRILLVNCSTGRGPEKEPAQP